MSEMLFLYKELTKMAKANELKDSSLKFSVTINENYGQMIEELSSRTKITRAELARHLICTALDEIDLVYNLKNDPDFDYSVTALVEEDLAELEEFRIIEKYRKKSSRLSEVENMLENFDSLSKSFEPEKKKEIFGQLNKELNELKEELGQ